MAVVALATPAGATRAADSGVAPRAGAAVAGQDFKPEARPRPGRTDSP